MSEGWKERLLLELAELTSKTEKLEHFLSHEEANALSETQRGLLHAQLGVMNAYVSILTLRRTTV